ncbi:MAG TPA: hypothetical protein VKN82_09225, partial [Desulfohalobiaceae bacterium]|nr:hypothetical protein [Desulfohalobiaceae bacterium]
KKDDDLPEDIRKILDELEKRISEMSLSKKNRPELQEDIMAIKSLIHVISRMEDSNDDPQND